MEIMDNISLSKLANRFKSFGLTVQWDNSWRLTENLIEIATPYFRVITRKGRVKVFYGQEN